MKKAITKHVAAMTTALMLMGCCNENGVCYGPDLYEAPAPIPRCSTKPQFWNDSCGDQADS